MKFFTQDTNIDQLQALVSMGILDGIIIDKLTPATMKQASNSSTIEVLKLLPEYADILIGATLDVNDLQYSDNEIVARVGAMGRYIGSNFYIILPVTQDTIGLCSMLTKKGIVVHMSQCHTAGQVLLAARAGAGFISVTVDLYDRIGINVADLLTDIRHILDNYDTLDTKIMVTRVTTATQLVELAKMGVDAVSASYEVVRQIAISPSTQAL